MYAPTAQAIAGRHGQPLANFRCNPDDHDRLEVNALTYDDTGVSGSASGPSTLANTWTGPMLALPAHGPTADRLLRKEAGKRGLGTGLSAVGFTAVVASYLHADALSGAPLPGVFLGVQNSTTWLFGVGDAQRSGADHIWIAWWPPRTDRPVPRGAVPGFLQVLDDGPGRTGQARA